ncbi:hypothetical protein ABB37_05324 [Leptomonas pyrrhocoris]|uniref:Uncharacterized protein n=1 Tax=Leptomonas pyrrhocoris TaxID=157538 RepID=A0A0M9FZV8_LEPPY|nr:hypothetical protein ABB37_05324 [Leptomonas pyrrhocoris]KPA79495.1 hypothetical protein ABB37_05324 [Leptomonas pyrrhocoris]|eukprot:XP_015657934.1 hypothetical protein ABB37_05324 [Leptomonas pyrrhocoris]
MLSAVDSAALAATAPAQDVTADVVNVYCVEVTAETTEKVRALLESIHNGEAPTADTLSRVGATGVELAASADTTVLDIREVVARQQLNGPKAATAVPTNDDVCLTLFAVRRGAPHAETAPATATGGATNAEEATATQDDDDPLVALPDGLTLAEVLKCPHVFVAAAEGEEINRMPARAVTAATAPTLLLFYARGSRWGGYCCCCGGLVAAIVSIFCGCCGHRPAHHRAPRVSRVSSGNPLSGCSTDGCYPHETPACYPTDNAYYPPYNNNPPPTYAGVPQAQFYYPPPQVRYSNGSDAQGPHKQF